MQPLNDSVQTAQGAVLGARSSAPGRRTEVTEQRNGYLPWEQPMQTEEQTQNWLGSDKML